MSDVIVIKKGNMEIAKIDRSNLIDVEPTHDGIVFSLKNGVQIYCTDNYMPVYTKDVMKNTANSFPNADLAYDLANYNKPVVATPKKK